MPCEQLQQLSGLGEDEAPTPDPSAAIPTLTLFPFTPEAELSPGVWSPIYLEYGTQVSFTLAPCNTAASVACGARATDDDPDYPDISADITVRC